ncbi:MAG: site-specific DNA-methyltransferase [Gammaproteobacteria bacterium]|nr:site-specific DNA-methyltransferase [Gammaproteobacteria bacterium]
MNTYDAKANGVGCYHDWINHERAKLLQERCPAAKRVVVIGNCDLYEGDCLEVMKALEPVDCVVTSPPYDDLRDYGSDYDGVDLFAAISTISDKLSDGGVCVWNVADGTINGSESGTSFKQALHAMDCGLRLHDTMIYIKDNVNFPESTRYFSGHEFMFIFSNGAPKTFNPLIDRPNKWAGTTMHGTDRQPNGSVKQISGIGKTIKPYGMRFNWWRLTNNNNPTSHPAPMPYSMAHDHIKTWTNTQETILDPFMGSGTTGVACVKLGRRFIGIELDPGYFDIAVNRIRKTSYQPDLFVEQPEPKPVQEDLDL